jgi:DNA-binding helix-hairpin-helix protein with protein kinase domain
MIAATGATRADVALAQLDLGEKLGGGGQGEVFRLRNRPGEVFKRYLSPSVYADALTALVRFPESLAEKDREALHRQTAWPLARVTDGARVTGLLMREVPQTFVGLSAAGPKLRELQYLLYPPKPLWGDIQPLDTTGRIEVAQQFVRLCRIFQDNGIVMGDVSMSNVLWAAGFPAQIFLIDCDGFCLSKMRPVLPQPETPDWDDPQMPSTKADLDTDRYKVALLVGRVLAGNAAVRPGQPLPLPADLPDPIGHMVIACFSAAGGPHGTRPTVAEWHQAVSGRGTIALPPRQPAAPPAPQLPMAPVDGGSTRTRGSIPLQPRTP